MTIKNKKKQNKYNDMVNKIFLVFLKIKILITIIN